MVFYCRPPPKICDRTLALSILEDWWLSGYPPVNWRHPIYRHDIMTNGMVTFSEPNEPCIHEHILMIYDNVICLFMDSILGVLLMRIPAVSIGGTALPGWICSLPRNQIKKMKSDHILPDIWLYWMRKHKAQNLAEIISKSRLYWQCCQIRNEQTPDNLQSKTC